MRKAGRRWRNALPYVCFFCLALTLAMGLYTWRYEPDRYRAEYAFFAEPPYAAGQDAVQLSRMLVQDCDALLDTQAFQDKVLSACASDGLTRLNALGKDGTHIIRVAAVGVSPQIVTDLANAAGQELLLQAQSVLGATNGKELARAALPDAPFAPNRPLKTLWMLLVSFAGLSLLGALFGSSRAAMQWKPGRVGQTALPCLGGVVEMERLLRGYEKRKRRNTPTFYDEADHLVRENVREVVLALRASSERPIGSLTVTGMGTASPEFSLLLASELATEGFNVLLMEMDAYAPQLREWLGARGRMDVLDCIDNESALGAALQPTAMPRLCFMDACHAPGFVTALAATDAFAAFLDDAVHTFRYVILNAPPADTLSDAAMLGAVTDATLLTVRDGRYACQEIDALARRLGQTVKRLAGFALCGVPRRRFPRDARRQPKIKA